MEFDWLLRPQYSLMDVGLYVLVGLSLALGLLVLFGLFVGGWDMVQSWWQDRRDRKEERDGRRTDPPRTAPVTERRIVAGSPAHDA